jgi:hypothetical protein
MSRHYKGRYSSPRNNRRACLCRDGSYSRDCCDGDYFAQGIGNVTGEGITDVIYKYIIESCSDSHRHHAHIHLTPLTVGKVYYLTLENHHDECYTIIQESGSEGIHINTASSLYDDCATCQADN